MATNRRTEEKRADEMANMLRQAVDCHQSGLRREAEALYRAILALNPKQPDANHNLGLLVQQAGKIKESLCYFEAAVKSGPRFAQYWISYITVLCQARGTTEAKSALDEGISRGLGSETVNLLKKRIGEYVSESQRNEILNAISSGHYSEVIHLVSQLVRSNSEDGFSWKGLGVALKQVGKISEAELAMRKAIELMPDDPESYSNLSVVLNEMGDHAGAAESARKAIALNSDFADAYNNLALALSELGEYSESETNCRKAISLKPEYPEAFHNLGNALKLQGKIVDSIKAYENALRIKPNLVETHRSLGSIKKFTADDQQLLDLSDLYRSLQTEAQKTHVCFTLGKAYEDIGDTEKAFGFYSEGNQIRKKQLHYSIEQDRSLFGKIKSAFHKLPSIDPAPIVEVNPILIVGMPRSGTSLVEQILASHSLVNGAGELRVLSDLALRHFQNARDFEVGECSKRIVSTYFKELIKISDGHPVVADKMPQNFLWIGFFLLTNPDIKVIHSVRDPMAVCWSIYRLFFPANGFGAAYDLTDLGEYYLMYQDLMAFWHEKFPGRIYDLNYERLTENQEDETRKLLEYCGLPWDERCMEFEKTQRVVRTASATQVRQKMYTGSSEAWRPYETYLGPLMKALGRT